MAKRKTKFADGGYLTASERAAIGVPERPNYKHGTMSADSDVPNTFVGNVKERVMNLMTPNVAAKIAARNKAMQDAVDATDDTTPPKTPGMKKGGKVKPRGVGVARKGHGKGRMV